MRDDPAPHLFDDVFNVADWEFAQVSVYEGVLFDLYGTLVAPFRRREHTAVLRECADLLEVAPQPLHDLWVKSFPERIGGAFPSVSDCFRWLIAQLDAPVVPGRLADAERLYLQFAQEGLAPLPGALDLLRWVKARDLPIGLVSNCAPEIPAIWHDSPLAPYFDFCAFSCTVGRAKPHADIYLAAVDALGVDAAATLYVGDGSDTELTGARACGLNPVLVEVDLSNTYDQSRIDVIAWTGPRIRSFDELPALLEGPR